MRNSVVARLSLIAGSIAVSASAGIAAAQKTAAQEPYEIVAPPACVNYEGETVRFVERTSEGDLAAGMAARDEDGMPLVIRSNYSAAPPEFQRFIDTHECAHHETGDVDLPHPPRNSPEHLMNESVADCVAILRLRDEQGFDEAALETLFTALRHDMTAAGFGDITIDSRLSNISSCYARDRTARDLIDKVLTERGLPAE